MFLSRFATSLRNGHLFIFACGIEFLLKVEIAHELLFHQIPVSSEDPTRDKLRSLIRQTVRLCRPGSLKLSPSIKKRES